MSFVVYVRLATRPVPKRLSEIDVNLNFQFVINSDHYNFCVARVYCCIAQLFFFYVPFATCQIMILKLQCAKIYIQ